MKFVGCIVTSQKQLSEVGAQKDNPSASRRRNEKQMIAKKICFSFLSYGKFNWSAITGFFELTITNKIVNFEQLKKAWIVHTILHDKVVGGLM